MSSVIKTPAELLYDAEVAYLESKGWERDKLRKVEPGKEPGWVEPPGRHRHRRVLAHGHAVNSQKANDAWERKFPGTVRPTQEELDD
jgi:hypothetical protein